MWPNKQQGKATTLKLQDEYSYIITVWTQKLHNKIINIEAPFYSL